MYLGCKRLSLAVHGKVANWSRLDGLTPNASHTPTPRTVNGSKRKPDFATPSVSKTTKIEANSSPLGSNTPSKPANKSSTDGPRYVQGEVCRNWLTQ